MFCKNLLTKNMLLREFEVKSKWFEDLIVKDVFIKLYLKIGKTELDSVITFAPFNPGHKFLYTKNRILSHYSTPKVWIQ